jgi:hypothetical protein
MGMGMGLCSNDEMGIFEYSLDKQDQKKNPPTATGDVSPKKIDAGQIVADGSVSIKKLVARWLARTVPVTVPVQYSAK